MLRDTLKSLFGALVFSQENGSLGKVKLLVVDNGPDFNCMVILENLLNEFNWQAQQISTRLISGHGNIGFGAGHNLAFSQTSTTDFHLILNPDVILNPNSIQEAIAFMSAHQDVGLIAPYIIGPDGLQQFLCKRYPSVFDLILRGFAPPVVRQLFHKRLEIYEMRDVCHQDQPVLDIPLISGCFMFFRHNLLKKVGGVANKYFMYFEDYDLSLRLGKISRLAYVPSMRIQHFGGNTANKGWRHIIMFCRSAITFFQEHGWKLW
jgi:GT2 family glycosyltransferase